MYLGRDYIRWDNREMAEPTVFRPGGVSYLRIPAPDPKSAADFYAGVFGRRSTPIARIRASRTAAGMSSDTSEPTSRLPAMRA